ncbi:MAG: hypothetical protein AB9819_03260 [Methanomassiliicoccales archaeon]
MDYIADNAANCPRCNAPLQEWVISSRLSRVTRNRSSTSSRLSRVTRNRSRSTSSPRRADTTPRRRAVTYQQPPMPPKRVATVKNINLTEILMVVSGMFLLAAAMNNLSWFYAPAIVLGIVSLLAGLVALGTVFIPDLAKQMKGEMMDMLVLVFGLVLVIWGLSVNFAGYGASGAFVFTGGLGLLAAGALRMGILK